MVLKVFESQDGCTIPILVPLKINKYDQCRTIAVYKTQLKEIQIICFVQGLLKLYPNQLGGMFEIG